MQKIKLGIITAALVTIASFAHSAHINFDNTSVISSDSWTASGQTTGAWYGSNYTVENDTASLTESSCVLSTMFCGTGINSLMYAMPLDGVTNGRYQWSIETRYSSFLTQYNYGQVFLLKDGQSINLQGDIWNDKEHKSQVVGKDFPHLFTGDEKWHTFGTDFTITKHMLSEYDTIAFVLTGSKAGDQILEYRNFQTDLPIASTPVPEPATIALAGTGFAWIFARKRKK